MFTRTLRLALLLWPYLPSIAQNATPFAGAHGAGLANATSCLQNEWSLLNNVAGLASEENLRVAIGYDFNFGLPAATRLAAVCNVPGPIGTFGLGAFHFGDNVYNEQAIHAGFANKFGIAALGVRTSFLQYQAEGFGSAHLLTIGFGGIASLTDRLDVGAHIFHINQPTVDAAENEHLPTTMAVGVSFRPSQDVALFGEIEKDIDLKPVFRMALSYSPLEKISFRTGYSLGPEAAFFGCGFWPGLIKFDYALQYQPLLGINHVVSFAYRLKRS